MNRLLMLVALTVACDFGGQLLAGPCDGIDFDTVFFSDDFNTVPPCNPPDPSQWVLNHPIPLDQPGAYWWVEGKTFFPNPLVDYDRDAPFPHVVEVENGRDNRACEIDHYDYNPYDINPDDPDDPTHVKTTFLGGEFHTKKKFAPDRAYCFEARVRWPQPASDAPDAIFLTSFFSYGHDEINHDADEIDFEYLSDEIFGATPSVLTNTWDDSPDNGKKDDPELVPVDGLDITEWQVFRIYWYPDTCIEWFWVVNPDAQDESEVLLRTETDVTDIPDEPMSLWFNFWAAAGTPDQVNQETYDAFFVDYVEVRIPEPTSCMVLGVGAVLLLTRRRRLLRPRH